MGRPNIPRKDTDAASWMRHLSQRLQSNPELYFVPAAEIALVAEVVAAFRSALAITLSPDTRTTLATGNKQRTRAEAERVCRQVYRMIKNDPRVTPDAMQAIGIRIDKRARSRSAAPATSPMLFIDTHNNVHTVSWADENSRRRAKPAGCAMLQLFVAVGEGETGDALARADGNAVATKARLLNVYTSNRVRLFNDMHRDWLPELHAEGTSNGRVKTAAFVARWAGPKGQPGPWSRPLTLRLAA